MALRSKVAAVLAALLLALPVTSAAACLLHRPQIAGRVSHCQMLGHRGASAGQNARLNNQCCELSSGQSLPPSRPEAPQATVDSAGVVASATTTVDLPANQGEMPATVFPALGPSPNHQALLCVFLI